MLRCRACEPRNEVRERHRRCRFVAMHLRPEKHSHRARSEGDCANRPAVNRPADVSNAQSGSPEERLERPPKLRVRESPRSNCRHSVLFGYCSALRRAALRSPSKSIRRSARSRSTGSNCHCSHYQLRGSHRFLNDCSGGVCDKDSTHSTINARRQRQTLLRPREPALSNHRIRSPIRRADSPATRPAHQAAPPQTTGAIPAAAVIATSQDTLTTRPNVPLREMEATVSSARSP